MPEAIVHIQKMAPLLKALSTAYLTHGRKPDMVLACPVQVRAWSAEAAMGAYAKTPSQVVNIMGVPIREGPADQQVELHWIQKVRDDG